MVSGFVEDRNRCLLHTQTEHIFAITTKSQITNYHRAESESATAAHCSNHHHHCFNHHHHFSNHHHQRRQTFFYSEMQIGRKLIDPKLDLKSTNGQKGQEICHHFLIFVLISSSQKSASENYFDLSLRTVVDSWKVFIYDIKTAKCANHQQHILVNIWYQYIDLFVC